MTISSANDVEAQFQSKADAGSEPTKFSVKFTAKGAAIDVQNLADAYGMRGYFGGKYVKVRK